VTRFFFVFWVLQ